MMTATKSHFTTVEQFLESPTAYPDHPECVEIRETHISRVFLTERFAFKLKKPVTFDFLDFSDLPLRKRACEQEVKLNRRLADHVYLGVVPVCRTSVGGFELGGDGTPVEWLVKMRRLDDHKCLKTLIGAGAVSKRQVNDLAHRLARFYAEQPPAVIKSSEYLQNLARHIDSNRTALAEQFSTDEASVELSHSAQTRFLALFHELLNDRVCDGRVVDGHGDLRPEHVYFENEPLVIDCIEFNDEYRKNDIIDELSFLAMECEHLGAAPIGEAVLESYRQLSGDRPAHVLGTFYQCYRASVRAKTTSLQAKHRESAAYLRLAHEYAAELGPRLVIAMGGASGTGKSTLATALAEHLGGQILRTDQLRTELFSRTGSMRYKEGRYSERARRFVYEAMLHRVPDCFESTKTVVLDGTFGEAAVRRAVDQLCHDINAVLLHVHCHCPREVAVSRIQDRSGNGASSSEARVDLFPQQLGDLEPYDADCDVVSVDTTLPLASQLQAVEDRIRKIGFH